MIATTVLAEIRSAGPDVAPGEDPATIRRQLRARAVAVASAPPDVFDRAALDRLAQLEASLPAESPATGS